MAGGITRQHSAANWCHSTTDIAVQLPICHYVAYPPDACQFQSIPIVLALSTSFVLQF